MPSGALPQCGNFNESARVGVWAQFRVMQRSLPTGPTAGRGVGIQYCVFPSSYVFNGVSLALRGLVTSELDDQALANSMWIPTGCLQAHVEGILELLLGHLLGILQADPYHHECAS